MDDPVELPEKLYYKIGEVARIVGAEPHVLRYWEKEFSFVRPRKSRGGQRLYRRRDVEALIRIKTLLRDEGFTIAGARKRLNAERAARRAAASSDADSPDASTSASSIPPSPPDESTQRMIDELERLKQQCLELRQARAVTVRRLAATEETLRRVRRDLAALLGLLDSR